MVDINLLPDELRAKEEEEKEAAKKIPRVFEIKLTGPTKEEAAKKEKPKFGKKFFPIFQKEKAKPPVPPPPSSLPTAKILKPPEKIKVELSKIFSKPPAKTTLTNGEISEKKTPPSKMEPKPLPEKPPIKIPPAKKIEILPKLEPLPSVKKKFSWRSFFQSFFAFKFFKPKPVSDKLVTKRKPGEIKKPAKIQKLKLEINLIPEELAHHPEFNLSQKFLVLLIFAFSTFLVVLGLRELIKLQQGEITSKTEAISQRVALLKQKIDDLQAERLAVLKFKDQLSAIQDLLVKHLYWTKFFDALEKNTIDEVFYTNFAATDSGDLTLSAVGKTYQSVARQLVAFRQATDFVKDVSITSASAEVNDVGEVEFITFDINLQLVDGVFLIPFQPVK